MKNNHKKILFTVALVAVAYYLLRKKSDSLATGATNESGLGKILSLPAEFLEAAKARITEQKKLLEQDYSVAAGAINGTEGQARVEAEARLKSVANALNGDAALSPEFNPLS